MSQSIFTQFYTMPIHNIVILLAIATWICLRLKERFQNLWVCRLLFLATFIGFTSVILHLTISTRDVSATDSLLLVPFHSYREVLAGGNPEIYRSNFMNAVLFYPAGLLATVLLPEKWPGWCKCILVILVFGALSAGIEYVQYTYALGRCEIDDVIHNTAGAFIGSLAALLMPPLLVWAEKAGKMLWARYAGNHKDTC